MPVFVWIPPIDCAIIGDRHCISSRGVSLEAVIAAKLSNLLQLYSISCESLDDGAGEPALRRSLVNRAGLL